MTQILPALWVLSETRYRHMSSYEFIAHSLTSKCIVLLVLFPSPVFSRKRLKKTSFILTEREDESQRMREMVRDYTSPHREEERARTHTHTHTHTHSCCVVPASCRTKFQC